MKLVRLLLASACLLFFSGHASADDYYFKCTVNGCTPQTSAYAAAVQYLTPGIGLPQGSGTSTVTSCSRYSNAYLCDATYPDGSPTQVFVSVSGNSCPVGSTLKENGSCVSSARDGDICTDQSHARGDLVAVYDSSIDGCIAWPDAKTPALCKYLSGKTEGGTSQVPGKIISPGNAVAPPNYVSEGLNCVVSTITSSKCVVSVDGTATCEVTGKYTGEVGAGDKKIPDYDCSVTKNCATLEPQTTKTSDPCTMSGDGSSQNCTSDTEVKQQGTQNCGTVNGAYTCITVPPKSDGVKITTNVTTSTATDGTVIKTQTDTATKTTCTDINTCASAKSVTTTVTKTNGTAVNSNTTCTGLCAGDGKGISASGVGTCTTADCGSGAGTASTSNDCKIPPPCDGDPFLCSILKQSAINSCLERALATDAEKADTDKKVKEQQDQLAANQKTLDDDTSNFFANFQLKTSSNSTFAGKCLADYPFDVLGKTFTLEFSRVCPALDFLYLLTSAIAYLVAARIVFKEV